MVKLGSGRLDWTLQIGYPPPLKESGARRRAQEKARHWNSFKETQRRLNSEVFRSWGLTSDQASGRRGRETSGRIFCGRAPQGRTEVGFSEHRRYLDHDNVLGTWPDVLLTTRHFTHTGSLGGTCRKFITKSKKVVCSGEQ